MVPNAKKSSSFFICISTKKNYCNYINSLVRAKIYTEERRDKKDELVNIRRQTVFFIWSRICLTRLRAHRKGGHETIGGESQMRRVIHKYNRYKLLINSVINNSTVNHAGKEKKLKIQFVNHKLAKHFLIHIQAESNITDCGTDNKQHKPSVNRRKRPNEV